MRSIRWLAVIAACGALGSSACAVAPYLYTGEVERSSVESTPRPTQCGSANVRLLAERGGAYHGLATQPIGIANEASTPCTVAKAPVFVVSGPDVSTPVSVRMARFPRSGLTIAAGETAWFVVAATADCSGGQQVATRARVSLAKHAEPAVVSDVLVPLGCGAPGVALGRNRGVTTLVDVICTNSGRDQTRCSKRPVSTS